MIFRHAASSSAIRPGVWDICLLRFLLQPWYFVCDIYNTENLIAVCTTVVVWIVSASWKRAVRLMTEIGPLMEIKLHFIGKLISLCWLLWIHTRWIPNSLCYSWVSWQLTIPSDVSQLYRAMCCAALIVPHNLRHGLIHDCPTRRRIALLDFLFLWEILLGLISVLRLMVTMFVVSERDKAKSFGL